MFRLGSIFLLCVLPLAAEEARISGGLSPDGKFEIIVSDEIAKPEYASDHEFVLRDTQSKKKLMKISDAGYAHSIRQEIDSESLQHLNCAVLWNPSSTAFAFNLRDSKRSRSTSLFVLRDGSFKQVLLKDAFHLITKELGIAAVNRCYFEDPLRWEGKTTLILQSSGDCVLPNLPSDEAGRWFEYEVTFDLTDTKPPSIKRLSLKDHNG